MSKNGTSWAPMYYFSFSGPKFENLTQKTLRFKGDISHFEAKNSSKKHQRTNRSKHARGEFWRSKGAILKENGHFRIPGPSLILFPQIPEPELPKTAVETAGKLPVKLRALGGVLAQSPQQFPGREMGIGIGNGNFIDSRIITDQYRYRSLWGKIYLKKVTCT